VDVILTLPELVGLAYINAESQLERLKKTAMLTSVYVNASGR